jgi:hypothetical protein
LAAAALAFHATALAPPAPIVLLTGTLAGQQIETFKKTLHAFCEESGCTLSHQDIPASGPELSTFWSISANGAKQLIISAYQYKGSVHFSVSTSPICALARWSLEHKTPLINRLDRAGLLIKAEEDEKCINSLKPQATAS